MWFVRVTFPGRAHLLLYFVLFVVVVVVVVVVVKAVQSSLHFATVKELKLSPDSECIDTNQMCILKQDWI